MCVMGRRARDLEVAADSPAENAYELRVASPTRNTDWMYSRLRIHSLL